MSVMVDSLFSKALRVYMLVLFDTKTLVIKQSQFVIIYIVFQMFLRNFVKLECGKILV